MMIDIVFSDVVGGPWLDTSDGPHSWLFKSWPFRWPFHATLHQENVNALDMVGAVRQIDPDIVMSFGTWRNIHDDETLDKGGYSKDFRATELDHYHISRRQSKVFKGQEFLTCVIRSVPVHASNASFLCIAPQRYIGDTMSMKDRPEITFLVNTEESKNS